MFVMLCYVMLCYVMLCYVMLCYVMLCYVMLCYVMLCYVMLCYVMLCYVMLCYVMLCYVLLCRVMLSCVAKYSIAYCKTIIEVPDRKPRNVVYTGTAPVKSMLFSQEKRLKKQGTILFIFLLTRLHYKRDTGHREKTR